MTQKQILEFNKRCAEFLGAIYSENAEAWGFGNAKNIGSKKYNGVMYHNIIEAERFEKELKFDSDWSWIMEVVEAIEKLDKIEDSVYRVTTFCNICKIDTSNGEIAWSKSVTKQEAVVEAINQFLIWYNEHKVN